MSKALNLKAGKFMSSDEPSKLGAHEKSRGGLGIKFTELLEKPTAVVLTIITLFGILLSVGIWIGDTQSSLQQIKESQQQSREDFKSFQVEFKTEMKSLRDEVSLVAVEMKSVSGELKGLK